MDELRDSISAFVSAEARIFFVKADPESLGDRSEALGRNFRHKPHRVRQRDARGKAVGDIPRGTDLMSQRMRDTEASVEGAENRHPGSDLALPAMVQLVFSGGLQRGFQM